MSMLVHMLGSSYTFAPYDRSRTFLGSDAVTPPESPESPESPETPETPTGTERYLRVNSIIDTIGRNAPSFGEGIARVFGRGTEGIRSGMPINTDYTTGGSDSTGGNSGSGSGSESEFPIVPVAIGGAVILGIMVMGKRRRK